MVLTLDGVLMDVEAMKRKFGVDHAIAPISALLVETEQSAS